MMKHFKKVIFFVPLAATALAELIFALLEKSGLALRSVPSAILCGLLVLSIIAAFAGIAYSVYKLCAKKEKAGYKVLSGCLSAVLVAASVCVILLSLFAGAFGFQPEHVVEKNGKKMVASVNSFTDVFVYYYEYKGHFFRGTERLGEEWYGSGGYDPFTTEMKSAPKTSTFK